MNRGVIILIIVVSVGIFVGLSIWGWQNRYGGPLPPTPPTFQELAMGKLAKDLPLTPEGLEDDLWRTLKPLTVDLVHQILVVPRAKEGIVPRIDVRAFHNGTKAYFMLEWKDSTPSLSHDSGEFPDCVAVGLTLAKGQAEPISIMMGFQSPLNIWQWKADLDAKLWSKKGSSPRETPNRHYPTPKDPGIPTVVEIPTDKTPNACQDLIATRPGTVTIKDRNSLAGRGRWKDGTWRVIITRALTTDDAERDAQLTKDLNVTFAVWDGEKGHRGSRKSISEWVTLKLGSQSSATAAHSSKGPTKALAGIFPVLTTGFRPQTASLATVLATAKPSPPVAEPGEEPIVFKILAKRFEYAISRQGKDGVFEPLDPPGQITVQKGQLVKFQLVSLDVTHGLYLDGYGINIKARPGPPEAAKKLTSEATFRADQTGRFTFRCSETCGEFHPYMVGFITVEPNSRYHIFLGITLAGCLAVGAGAVLTTRKSGKRGASDA